MLRSFPLIYLYPREEEEEEEVTQIRPAETFRDSGFFVGIPAAQIFYRGKQTRKSEHFLTFV